MIMPSEDSTKMVIYYMKIPAKLIFKVVRNNSLLSCILQFISKIVYFILPLIAIHPWPIVSAKIFDSLVIFGSIINVKCHGLSSHIT